MVQHKSVNKIDDLDNMNVPVDGKFLKFVSPNCTWTDPPGGSTVKSGKETGMADNSSRAVTFTSAFSSTPNVTATFSNESNKTDIIELISITTTGFTITVHKGHGGANDTHDVEWIATDAGN